MQLNSLNPRILAGLLNIGVPSWQLSPKAFPWKPSKPVAHHRPQNDQGGEFPIAVKRLSSDVLLPGQQGMPVLLYLGHDKTVALVLLFEGPRNGDWGTGLWVPSVV